MAVEEILRKRRKAERHDGRIFCDPSGLLVDCDRRKSPEQKLEERQTKASKKDAKRLNVMGRMKTDVLS